MRQRTFSFSLLQAWCICKHTNNNFKIFNSIKRVEGVNHVSILHALGNQPELLRCPLQGIFQECWLRITLQGRKPLDDSGLLYLIWIASSWVSTSLPITKRVLTYRSLNDPCLIKWGVSGTVIPDWVTSLRSWNRMPFNQRKALPRVGILPPKLFPFLHMLLLYKALGSDCLGLDPDSTTPLAV